MLIVFGPITMELHITTNQPPAPGESITAGHYTLNAGGRGANQALAAARSNAKVALVGRTGDDDYAKRILDKIKKDGVITSGVGKIEGTHTGLDIICTTTNSAKTKIKTAGANAQAISEQVPDEILKPDGFVLVQTNLQMDESFAVLERAKARGTKTILNLAPSVELSKTMMDQLDYLIVNHGEIKELVKTLGLPEMKSHANIAHALAKMGNLTCIVTESEKGCTVFTPDDEGWHIPTFKIDKVVDHSGAEDVFCGTFAACLQAQKPLIEALKHANAAATLACTKQGGQDSFPYSSEIEEKVNELPDIEKLN